MPQATEQHATCTCHVHVHVARFAKMQLAFWKLSSCAAAPSVGVGSCALRATTTSTCSARRWPRSPPAAP
eukprot:1209028-Prymnesium_polylepis.2